jgi:hypothetical protein
MVDASWRCTAAPMGRLKGVCSDAVSFSRAPDRNILRNCAELCTASAVLLHAVPACFPLKSSLIGFQSVPQVH